MSAKLPRHVETDDLFIDGVIGLREAILRYQPQRGCKLRSYAQPRIRGEILDGIRDRDHLSRSHRASGRAPDVRSLHAERGTPGYREVRFVDLLPDPAADQVMRQIDQRDSFASRLRGLDRTSRAALHLYYHDNLTMREIGKALDLSESRISQIISSAIQRLRSEKT